MKRIACETGQTIIAAKYLNALTSTVANKDRVMVRDIIKKYKGNIFYPSQVVEIANKIGDIRLSAFSLGLTERAVTQCLEGNILPDDMVFTAAYLATLLGVSPLTFNNNVRKIFGVRDYGVYLSKEEAILIIKKSRRGAMRDVCSIDEAAEISGISKNRLVQIFRHYDVEKVMMANMKMYPVRFAEILRDELCKSEIPKMVSVINTETGGKFNTGEGFSTKITFSRGKNRHNLVSKKWKKILVEILPSTQNMRELSIAFSLRMEDEYRATKERLKEASLVQEI